MRSDKENYGYFVPITILELIEALNEAIDESEDFTGQEHIIGIDYIEDDDYDVPPGSILIHLQQNTLNPDKPRYGTVVLTPGKTKWVM